MGAWTFFLEDATTGASYGRQSAPINSPPAPDAMYYTQVKSSPRHVKLSIFSRMTNTLDTEFHSFENRKRMVEKLMGSYYKDNLTNNYIWLQLMMLNECVREFCKGS